MFRYRYRYLVWVKFGIGIRRYRYRFGIGYRFAHPCTWYQQTKKSWNQTSRSEEHMILIMKMKDIISKLQHHR
ncbi:hypothetical protein HanPI659440_Chr15g0580831 [Helianthus annuus]|nr:hypothetical protein HanPI659440_Chr15g0580831 [Helianthus annuus]